MRRRVVIAGAGSMVVVIVALIAIDQATTLPDRANVAWTRSESAHFEILVPRGVREPEGFADSLEAAWRVIRAALPPADDAPRVVLAISRAHAATLNGGSAVAGMYLPGAHAVVIVRSVVNPVLLRHELSHAATASLWGKPAANAAWLVEGIATALGGGCEDASPRSAARILLMNGTLPTLSTLEHEFHGIEEIRSYPAAGSIVQLLHERGQASTLRDLWRGAPLSIDEFAWRDWIRAGAFAAPRTEGAPPDRMPHCKRA